MSVDGQTDSGYSTTDSVEDWYSLDTMVKHTYHGWKFSKKKIKKICAYAEISIDDELDRMPYHSFEKFYRLCALFDPMSSHKIKREFAVLKREEADGSSETDVEDDYVKADEKTTVNTFFQESEEQEETENPPMNVPRAESEVIMRNALHSKTPRKEAPQRDPSFDDSTPTTVSQILKHTVSLYPSATCMTFRKNGKLQKVTWDEYYEKSTIVAKALISLCKDRFEKVLEYYHKHGDKQTFNSKHVPLDLDYLRPVVHTSFIQLTKETFELISACALCGAVFAPLKEPTNCLASHLKEILKKSDAPIIFVDNKAILEQLLLIKEDLLVVYIGDASDFETIKYETLHILSWSKFLGYAKEKTEDLFERLQLLQTPYDLAYIIYRADDSNTFKGHMLSHRNVTLSAALTGKFYGIDENDETLVITLLNSRSNLQLNYHLFLRFALTVHIIPREASEDLTQFCAYVKEVHPTIFFARPRFWERLQQFVAMSITQNKFTNFNRAAFETALNSVKEGFSDRPTVSLKLGSTGDDFGFGHIWLAGCHSAPLKRETYLFFAAFGIGIHWMYTSLRCGVIAASPLDGETTSYAGSVLGARFPDSKGDSSSDDSDTDDYFASDSSSSSSSDQGSLDSSMSTGSFVGAFSRLRKSQTSVKRRPSDLVKLKLFFDVIVAGRAYYEIGVKGETVFKGYYKTAQTSDLFKKNDIKKQGYTLTGDYGNFVDTRTGVDEKVFISGRVDTEFKDIRLVPHKVLRIAGRKSVCPTAR